MGSPTTIIIIDDWHLSHFVLDDLAIGHFDFGIQARNLVTFEVCEISFSQEFLHLIVISNFVSF